MQLVLLGIIVMAIAISYKYKTSRKPTLVADPSIYLEASEIASIQAQVETEIHPNMYLNAAEIAAIKTKVQAGAEPWKTAYERLIADANQALNEKPYSVTKDGGSNDGHDYEAISIYCGWKEVDGKEPDCRDGKINPNIKRQDYEEAISLGKAVHNLGLAYAFTQDSKYAQQAISLIRAWCIEPNTRMNPKFTNSQSYIELSITIPGLFFGADLLYNYPDWSAQEKETFTEWVAAIANSALKWHRTNNFENWRVNFVAAAGAFLGDESLLNYAFGRYKELIPIQIDPKGRMIKELNRTTSLTYSLYALNAMIQTAEIARHQGVNLYDYTSDGKRGLKLALDYHATYAADTNPRDWSYQQIKPLNKQDNVALYELAYSYWQEPSYLKVINSWQRPMIEKRILKQITLTHSNRFEL